MRSARARFLLLLAAWGCQTSGPQLFSERELRALQDEQSAALAWNKTTRCLRPVLRGPTSPGPADEDIAALVSSPNLAACVAASPAGLRAALDAAASGDGQAAGPIEEPAAARSLTDMRSLDQDVFDSFLRCRELPAAVARAVAHQDACSPWLPGRRAEPESFAPFLAVGRALEIQARNPAQEGDAVRSLLMLLDFLRLGQDMARGGSSVLPAMVAATASAGPLGQAERILADSRLAPDAIDELAREVDALGATEPTVASVIQGDASSMIAMELDPSAGRASPFAVIDDGLDAADTRALGWTAIRQNARAERAACPPDASARTCIAALERLRQSSSEATVRRGAKSRRAGFLAVLRGIGAGLRTPFVKRLFWRRLRLAALRAHLEARRITTATGACPDLSAWELPPLADLRRPAWLGDTIAVRALGPGSVELVAPAWLAPVRAWTVRCP